MCLLIDLVIGLDFGGIRRGFHGADITLVGVVFRFLTDQFSIGVVLIFIAIIERVFLFRQLDDGTPFFRLQVSPNAGSVALGAQLIERRVPIDDGLAFGAFTGFGIIGRLLRIVAGGESQQRDGRHHDR